jgi:uncharacterized membrane protein
MKKCVEGLMVKSQQWFGIIALFTVLTMLIVYVVPVDSQFVVVRYVFGYVFVVSLPGYCLVNALFSKGNKLDLIEETVLSVALSFGIAGIVGLFLGLSPIGINFTSITVSLSVIVLILSAVAFMRKRIYEKVTDITPEHAK